MRICKKSRAPYKSNKYLGQRNNRFVQTYVQTAVIILKNAILCFKYYQYKREYSPTKQTIDFVSIV